MNLYIFISMPKREALNFSEHISEQASDHSKPFNVFGLNILHMNKLEWLLEIFGFPGVSLSYKIYY